MSYVATRIGSFEVLGLLGAGGQGQVYLARPWEDSAVRRLLVRRYLWVLRRGGMLSPSLAWHWRLAALKLAHPTTTDALHDEHSYLAAPGAQHPHLVQLYSRRCNTQISDLGLAEVAGRSTLWLALAYEAGLSLAHLLAQGRPPDLAWSLAVVAQAADALAHLHQRGLVHHDLRPANLLVHTPWRGRPQAVLIDLGAGETPDRPRRQAVYGVDSYLAPERRTADPAPATPQVDIFAVGRLLATLSAGQPVSAALAALIADATTADPVCRSAALPEMYTLLARLLALPERSDHADGCGADRPTAGESHSVWGLHAKRWPDQINVRG